MKKLGLLIIPIAFFLATPEAFALSPIVSTDPATSISQESAVLKGVLVSNGGIPIVSAGFSFGLTASYTHVASTTISIDDTDLITLNENEASNLLSRDVAFDSAGNIFVADIANASIKKFSPFGVFISQFGSYGMGEGQFLHPWHLAIDSLDNVYVSDFGLHKIQKFDSNGNYISQIGGVGSGSGEFTNPADLVFDSSGNIYVADQNNNRVQKFDQNGNYIFQFGTFGETGNGHFFQPHDVAIDSSGNIFVLDSGNHRVQKFNSSGVYQSQFGSLGFGAGQFVSPKGITLDSSDNIYVADGGNNRIQKFNSSGVFQSSFVTFDYFSPAPSPQDAIFDSNGDLYTINIDSFPTISVVKKLRQAIDPKQVIYLQCGETYHYRVFATNADGTSYGNDRTFQTGNCFPVATPNKEPITSRPTRRPITAKPESKSEVVQTATAIDAVESSKLESSKVETKLIKP